MDETAPQIRLVAGLGNAGAEYERTRHNVGFGVVDLLASEWGLAWERSKNWNLAWAKGEKAILVADTSASWRSPPVATSKRRNLPS